MTRLLTILLLALALRAPATEFFIDSSKTGASSNLGTAANPWTNWVPLGGTDGQWTFVAHGGDTIWVFPGTGYVGNRTVGGAVPDAINMYNITGLTNNPVVFKAVQTNGLVKTPPLLVSGSFFTFDGRKSDTYTNLVNFDNMANIYQITNNINWWIRGVYGFGTNVRDGVSCPNAGPQMRFTWLHVDPFTFNTNNWPAVPSSDTGPGSGTHGFNILQNTGEILHGGEIGYCYIEEADQTDVNILNNNAPIWGGFRIHHNVMAKVGDAGTRLSGGFEVDHNMIGQPWAIHGHPNGAVQAPNFSLFHHNIVKNTLDTMMYTPGGGSNFNGVAQGIKVYNNLFYTTKDWSYIYTNEFTSNKTFVGHSVAGMQFLVEANANHVLPWLPQYWTNFVFAQNTFIAGLGAVPTNADAGINNTISLPNRDAPGLPPDAPEDAGFVILTNMAAVNNLIYNVSPSSFGQSLGGFPGWIDRFNADTNTWMSTVTNHTSGILFDWGNTNSPNPNKGSTNLRFDYNVMAADQAPVATFGYNGPNSTNNTYTAASFNAAYATNGFTHNSGLVPSLVDTNNYDFHPRVFDAVLVGKGTNMSAFTNAPGGLPQFNMDLSGVTRPIATPSIGAYEPQTDMILHYTFDDLTPATGAVAIGAQPFVTDITGYGGNMLYFGFTNAPATNWPIRVAFTNATGPGYAYAAQFNFYTNQIPSYGNFPINQFGAITNVGVFSNLTAITVCCWGKYYSNAYVVATFLDTCEGSPGNGVTWSLGRNSAQQTSFDLFTNLDYNTSGTLHLNYPDNQSTDWHFYAATFSTTNKTMNIYLDGTNCASKDFTGYSPALTNIIVGTPSSGGSYPGKNGWISVGCRTHVGSPYLGDGDLFPNNGWLGGELADVRVYNRALTDGEVLAIFNGGGASGGSAPAADPAITVQPANVTVNQGQNATFTITATGTAPLHYFWKFNGGQVGTDFTSYTRVFCQPADSGGLVTCLVSNSVSSVLSATALLTVNSTNGAPVTFRGKGLHIRNGRGK